jgi:GT2 family glycosyltransferase
MVWRTLDMRVSVVVPTCDRPQELARCLSRLAPGLQTLDAAAYDVIVSDDGALTPAKDILASCYPFVGWISGPKRGPAANRNNGAAIAEADLLAFIDDDCIADATWLEALVSAAANSSADVFEGRTYADRPRQSLAEGSPVNETGGNLWSCNFAVRRNAFKRLGGFDDRFPYPTMEDVDFQVRCRKLGLAIEFVHTAGVCHPWRREGGWATKMRMRRSLLFFMTKHPEEQSFRSIRFWTGSIFWTVLRGVIRDGLAYRGAGMWHPVQIVAFQFTMVWTVSTERLLQRFGTWRETIAPRRHRR